MFTNSAFIISIWPTDFGYLFWSAIIVGFWLVFFNRMDPRDQNLRNFVAAIFLILLARYAYWRLFYTVLPAKIPTVQGFWIWFCFFIETMAIVESVLFILIMIRVTDRRPAADKFERVLRSMPPSELPTVDVYIPTYNEGIDVLERTIIGCLHLDWPQEKLKVWVLDDGKRDWLRDYCVEHGAGYIRREGNFHAKAGNINHAFEFTNGDYVAIFDADFVPFRQFLYRTIGFFIEPRVGIVQTPQHFFNRDYLQSNLKLQKSAPDDQRLFFDEMMPGRDSWDAAFWCGSCSVSRRTAMIECGGVPTHSITEDLLTTLVLLRHGYITRYLGEKLSHGLAPETLSGLLTQRKRWCRGTIQALYSKHGPFGKGLSFGKRLMFMPIHWIFSPLTRFFNFIVPLVFFWTGLSALLVDHFTQLLDYQLPFLLMNLFTVSWFIPKHYIPFVNTATASINALQIIPTVIKSLINPHESTKFGVTPKGRLNIKTKIYWFPLILSSSLFILTVTGMIINIIPESTIATDHGFFPVAAFWGCLNLGILFIMILLSFEHPRWRTHERFDTDAPIKVTIKDQVIDGIMSDISASGCSVFMETDLIHQLEDGEVIQLFIPEVGEMEAEFISFKDQKVRLIFKEYEAAIRENLIRYIYTGKFDNSITEKGRSNIWKDLWRSVAGKELDIQENTDLVQDRQAL